MKKYFNLWMLVAICYLSTWLVSCENKEPNDLTVAPSPSQFIVMGSVVDDANQPIPSIKISLDDPKVSSEEWSYYYANLCYSDKEGYFSFPIASNTSSWSEVEFPEELTLTAKDTAGIYETQTKTFTVEVLHRYPEGTQWYIVRDGHVQADFVLKRQ